MNAHAQQLSRLARLIIAFVCCFFIPGNKYYVVKMSCYYYYILAIDKSLTLKKMLKVNCNW